MLLLFVVTHFSHYILGVPCSSQHETILRGWTMGASAYSKRMPVFISSEYAECCAWLKDTRHTSLYSFRYCFVLSTCSVHSSFGVASTLRGTQCHWSTRRAKYSPTEMPPVWDVEEAVRRGKENRTCVYQITRDALVTADIVLR